MVTTIKRYNIVDLFAGAGGLSLGFVQTGRIDIVAAAENNPNARKTYKRNFKTERVYTDVQTIDYSELQKAVGHVDILIGGPPCQGFSNANRQHTSIISMNNRLVKEYVRAVCELKPDAFVMENVAMLKSQVHRFIVDQDDLSDERIMNMRLRDDEIDILPTKVEFEGTLITESDIKAAYVWKEPFYKVINLLYRYRINQPKFNLSLSKHQKRLSAQLKEILTEAKTNEELSTTQKIDCLMAQRILEYISLSTDFETVVQAIESALLVQKAHSKFNELSNNKITFTSDSVNGIIVAKVKSYAVRDYIKTILEDPPYNYKLFETTLNALDYGAPQKRERFIIVGIANNYPVEYTPPKGSFSNYNYRTVRDAIADLQEIAPSLTADQRYIELEPHYNAKGIEKELRGRLLYNHTITATRDTALSRFKALNEGENFHNLPLAMKSTYSKAERTQNTIYMRLKYDEPCGTVVNVRKSMWIHPILDRAISIREAARLQTFPDSFIFEGTKDSQYQQIGNAVPPFMARAIAQSVIEVLDRQNTD
ncbi:MAG: DNA cytosine methyltransferase [Pyramidobacter sp.]